MEHPLVLKQPPPEVLLADFGQSAMTFTVGFWMHLANSVGGAWVSSDLRHRIKEVFDEGGILLAFPQRDVHLDFRRPLEIRMSNAPARTKRMEIEASRAVAECR
jgi:potassium efflux system protein